jgi:NDP-sugar pyrophosphorylase family protein
MQVFILAGGPGTRIRAEFPDLPKPLIPICGKPFLERQISLLAEQGFSQFTLCVGYRASQIMEYFGAGTAWGVSLTYSVEPTPLGTAGALKHAASAFHETTLVLNGDTYLDVDYRAVIDYHNRQTPEVVGTLALVEVPDSARFGEVRVADDSRIAAFDEKVTGRDGPGLINAGAYVLEPRVLDLIPSGRASSLERDIFPALAAVGQLGGTIVTGSFVDIGTPAGYAELAALLTC